MYLNDKKLKQKSGTSNFETIEIKYFNINEIPESIAYEKNSKEQILMCFKAYKNPNWITLFD